VTESLDTSGSATRRDFSYKVGGTLEEMRTTSVKVGTFSHNGTCTQQRLPCEQRLLHL